MFVLGMLVGLATGVAIGMLYAPAPGRETRQTLTERAREAGERARGMGQTVREQVQRVRQRGESEMEERTS